MSKNMNKSGKAIVWFFYVLAILMLALACYMVYSAVAYLANYAATYGTDLSSMKSDVFQYVLQQAAPYLTYAALIFGIGKILSVVQGIASGAAVASEAPAKSMVEELAVEVEEPETVEVAAEETVEEAEEAAEETTEEVAEEAEETAEDAKEAAEEATEEVEDDAEDAAEEATEEKKVQE